MDEPASYGRVVFDLVVSKTQESVMFFNKFGGNQRRWNITITSSHKAGASFQTVSDNSNIKRQRESTTRGRATGGSRQTSVRTPPINDRRTRFASVHETIRSSWSPRTASSNQQRFTNSLRVGWLHLPRSVWG